MPTPTPPRSRWSVTLRIVGGFALLLVGGVLAIPGVPGPGIVLIVADLVLLAEHFDWARRLLDWAKSKFHRRPAGTAGES